MLSDAWLDAGCTVKRPIRVIDASCFVSGWVDANDWLVGIAIDVDGACECHFELDRENADRLVEGAVAGAAFVRLSEILRNALQDNEGEPCLGLVEELRRRGVDYEANWADDEN